jgi:hypothetical protein
MNRPNGWRKEEKNKRENSIAGLKINRKSRGDRNLTG